MFEENLNCIKNRSSRGGGLDCLEVTFIIEVSPGLFPGDNKSFPVAKMCLSHLQYNVACNFRYASQSAPLSTIMLV